MVRFYCASHEWVSFPILKIGEDYDPYPDSDIGTFLSRTAQGRVSVEIYDPMLWTPETMVLFWHEIHCPD